MTVAFNAATSDQNDNQVLTFAHTTAGSDRILIVAVGIFSTQVTVLGVTYNAVAMTSIASIRTGGAFLELWQLVAPAIGTNNVEVTLSDPPDRSQAVGAMSFTGVDQSTPLGTPVSGGGTGSDNLTSLIVASAVADLVIDGVAEQPDGAFGTLTVGAGQTERYKEPNPGNRVRTSGSTEPGAASVTMSWTFTGSLDHSHIAVNLKSALSASDVNIVKGGEYRLDFPDIDLVKSSSYRMSMPNLEITKTAAYRTRLLDLDLVKLGQYGVVAQADVIKPGQYKLIVPVEVTKGGDYRIVRTIDLTPTGEYRLIIIDVEVTKIGQFNLRSPINIQETAQYAVVSSDEVTKLATYLVGNLNMDLVKTAQYGVLLVNQEIPKTAAYRMFLGAQDLVKLGQYVLLMSSDIVKAAEFNLRSIIDVAKSGQYVLVSALGFDRLADYRIFLAANNIIVNGQYNAKLQTDLAFGGRYVLVTEKTELVKIFLPLDEQASQPGDIEQLDLVLSLDN